MHSVFEIDGLREYIVNVHFHTNYSLAALLSVDKQIQKWMEGWLTERKEAYDQFQQKIRSYEQVFGEEIPFYKDNGSYLLSLSEELYEAGHPPPSPIGKEGEKQPKRRGKCIGSVPGLVDAYNKLHDLAPFLIKKTLDQLFAEHIYTLQLDRPQSEGYSPHLTHLFLKALLDRLTVEKKEGTLKGLDLDCFSKKKAAPPKPDFLTLVTKEEGEVDILEEWLRAGTVAIKRLNIICTMYDAKARSKKFSEDMKIAFPEMKVTRL